MHPDRVVGGDEDAIRRAEFKMRELNAAWEVLRDPARRAAYDRGAQQALGGGVAATRTAPSRGAGPPAGVPDLEPEVEGQATVVRRRRSRWSRHGPAIVVGVLVGLAGVVGCLATVSGPTDPTQVETTDRFPVGSCVLLAQDSTVSEVPCEQPGALRVLGREPFPRPCPAGQRALVLLDREESLCIPGTGR